MIDSRQVEEAFQSAKQELVSNPALTWIKESALRERAYFVGLYCGLKSMAPEGNFEYPGLFVNAARKPVR
jgi:hypothetical protein